MGIKNFIFAIASFGVLASCTSSGDIIGMDEINLNGPRQIIHTVSTAGSTNVLTYSVGGNKFIKLSDSGNTVLNQISYNNSNKIANITGFFTDPATSNLTNMNINFVYSNDVLVALQGTEVSAGVTNDVATSFTYTNGKLTKTYTTKTPQGTGTPVVSYAQNDLSYNGYNVSQSVFTFGVLNGTIPVPGTVATTTYTSYDTKVSYLYGVPKEYAYFSSYNTTGANYISPNNPMSVTLNVAGATATKNTSYMYGVAAMPTTSTENNVVTTYSYQPFKN